MRLISVTFIVLTALGLNASAGVGGSQYINWSSTAAGCKFGTGSESLAAVYSQYGDVEWATGATGTMKLICPVHGLFPSAISDVPQILDVVFYDTDQTTDNCYVKAALLRNNRSATPGSGTIVTYDGTTDTSLNGSFYAYRNFESTQFNYTWDFDANFYWIEVTMFRNTTSCSTVFNGLTLSSLAT